MQLTIAILLIFLVLPLMVLAQPISSAEGLAFSDCNCSNANCYTIIKTLELTNILNGAVPAGSGQSTLTFETNSLPGGINAYWLVCVSHVPTNAIDGCTQYLMDTNGGFNPSVVIISNSIPGSMEELDVYAYLSCGAPFTNPVVSSCVLVQPLIPTMTASNLPFNFATSDNTNYAPVAWTAFNSNQVWSVTNTGYSLFYVFATNQTISIVSLVGNNPSGVSTEPINVWYSPDADINTTNWIVFGDGSLVIPNDATNVLVSLTNCPPATVKELMFQPASLFSDYTFSGLQAYGNPKAP